MSPSMKRTLVSRALAAAQAPIGEQAATMPDGILRKTPSIVCPRDIVYSALSHRPGCSRDANCTMLTSKKTISV